MQCPGCATSVPPNARYCRKCGREMLGQPSLPPQRAAAKIKPNVPLSGFLFIGGVVLGPALIVAGAWWHVPAVAWVGVACCILVAIILIVNVLLG